MSFRLLPTTSSLCMVILLPILWIGQKGLAQPPLEDEFFEKRIRPILVERCYECHSGDARRLEGSLRLDHGSFYPSGGDSGAAVDGENPSESLFLQAIRYEGYEMPPSGKLPAAEIDDLTKWVLAGAPWPEEPIPQSKKEIATFDLASRKDSHWAWSPIVSRPLPEMVKAWGPQSPIDVWIHEGLRSKDLAPVGPASREILIRRLHWDLLGIPPTDQELARWGEEPSEDWYEQMLDALLANPQFGVRFARHWMDLVRYAQSRGHEFDEDIPGAEHYRDYLVRAWNADLPYSDLVREHVAGDLQEHPRRHPTKRWNESILATGFWFLGEWVHSPVDTRKDETDRFDNMVDVFSKSFLGMTVACARCHDHKFDAISNEDYYAMYGYLRSSHYRLVRFETDEAEKKIQKELEHTRNQYRGRIESILNQWIPTLDESKRGELVQSMVSSKQGPSPLPSHDPRVRFDAATLPPESFRTNGPAFGLHVQPAGWYSLRLHPQTPNRVRASSFPSIAFDPFWLRQKLVLDRMNTQNRYAQVDQAGGTFLTPSFLLESDRLAFWVRGSFRVFTAVDSHRLIAGPLHGETVFESKAEKESGWRWVLGPNLSRYRNKRVHLEFSAIGSDGFELAQVVSGPVPEGARPAWDADRIEESFVRLQKGSDASIGNQSEDERKLDAWVIAELLDRWSETQSDSTAAAFREEWQRAVESWSEAEDALAKKAPWESRVAMAMQDGSGQNDFLLIRGNPDKPAEEVPRRFLEALGGKETVRNDIHGSGRLELAEQMLAPENPLVARVIANRLWHHLIGRGIVATTDDFGVQGKAPTHPELLDELAISLRERDWSLKSLIRSICLSNTYRQRTASGDDSPVDPSNEYLAFAHVKKLQGEAVRDGLFLVSGQLDNQLEGGTVRVHLNDFLTGRGRPNQSGPMDGRGRRSLYLEVRRNFLNPMLTAFDMPTPFSSMGRRNVSNVPAQALTMLNDPMIHALAERWADRMLKKDLSDRQRVVEMLRDARGREPSDGEVTRSLAFIEDAGGRSDQASAEIAPSASQRREAWKDFAHVLLNSKELLFCF
ncbi:Planctomycete cytochrome C [Pirellula sp. SH-Sr6A]|uniref:PSD1 and planctomycete cytochrome C domain-containing protein n=1 Tax=Pirellula sp. SH-Sr6A TaxID=1632865 RepID=UPI00078E4CAB|nr:PSD1 and planctomycete cytochrome C domain-containing protein [Pirellula sp. SH-Sr6A]AMV33635.1 Planctomycete cytochrome C [Pirellula sp. SH-Sr6A]